MKHFGGGGRKLYKSLGASGFEILLQSYVTKFLLLNNAIDEVLTKHVSVYLLNFD
jgi:hypothetical protein